MNRKRGTDCHSGLPESRCNVDGAGVGGVVVDGGGVG